MAIDTTDYNVAFRAPAIPYAPQVYDKESFEQFNNVLRLYFNQIDQALSSSRSTDQAEAAGWFIG